MRARSEDAALQAEAGGVEFKHGDVAEAVAIGVEEFVVVNGGAGAHHPHAVGTQESLRRLAFNGVAQCLLLAVDRGQIVFVKEKKTSGNDARQRQHRHYHAVDADAGGLHGGYLIGFFHQAKSDQHRDQHAHGRHGVVNRGGKRAGQKFAHGEPGHPVAQDVVQQLE